MNKEHLKRTMLSLTEGELRQAADSYAGFLGLARLDRDEPIEADERAQARISADLAASFDDQIHDMEHKLERLRGIDFGPRTEVSEGAVVRLRGGRNLVVAVSTARFECDGQEFMGISVDAPIYAALAGKGAGDTAMLNGRAFMIEQVY